MDNQPLPASQEAIDSGCTCTIRWSADYDDLPVWLDISTNWVELDPDCPLHGAKDSTNG